MRHSLFHARWAGKTIALAVATAMGMGAGSAYALTAPAFGTTAPAQGTGLVLDIWNSSTSAGEQVNLGYQFSDIAAAGALTPDSATSPYTFNATNPTGAAGGVYQLDFGTVPMFGQTFASGSGASYAVVTANGVPGTGTQAAFTLSGAVPTIASTSLTGNIVGAIGGMAWGPESASTSTIGGYTIDLTGTQNYSPIGGSFGSGSLNAGLTTGGAVGSALDFYLATAVIHKNAVVTPFANSAGDGFFFLSSGGDLTWNVLASSAPVPLPAAAWLFASGLAGLGAIGRRRRAALAVGI